jgi:ribosomal-protein-alanine N-acetyltransferase
VRRVELLGPPATRALAVPLARLHRAAFAEAPWDPEAISEIAGLAGFFCLLAWEGDMPAGFAFAFGVAEEYEIAALGVLPERRRTGIGRALLAALCAEVGKRGGRRLVLEVAADNAPARSLYAASGFLRIGRRRNYYRRAGCAVDAELLRIALVASPSSI